MRFQPLPATFQPYLIENRGACAAISDPNDSRCGITPALPPLAPELLLSAQDGLGRQAIWDYFPLSSSAGRSGHQLTFYAIPARASDGGYIDAEHFYFTSSMNAVANFEVSDGVDGLRLTQYGYTEAMYNNRGRGFPQPFSTGIGACADDGCRLRQTLRHRR